MNLRLRNSLARFILAAYVLAGVLLEVGHHDPHDIVLAAPASVSSHDCGDTEIHVPLDKRHDCLACTQSAQRIGIEVTQQIVVDAPFVSHCYAAVLCERLLATDVFHSGKRGPPLS